MRQRLHKRAAVLIWSGVLAALVAGTVEGPNETLWALAASLGTWGTLLLYLAERRFVRRLSTGLARVLRSNTESVDA